MQDVNQKLCKQLNFRSTEALKKEGYNLRRSAVYLRLPPKCGRTREENGM